MHCTTYPAPAPARVAVRCNAKPGNVAATKPARVTPTKWNLYSCRMPLIGLEGLAQMLEGLPPAARLVNIHTYLLLEAPDQSGVYLLDFLPTNPTAPSTALMLLTAGKAPGEVRVRKLGAQQVSISDRVRLLGSISHPDPLAEVQAFNRSYDKDIHLLLNNCMHYTNGLSRHLLVDPSCD